MSNLKQARWSDLPARNDRIVAKVAASEVGVRFTRMAKGQFDVEVDCWDRQNVFTADVASALEERGFRVFTGARGRIVALRRGWRAPSGFVKIEELAEGRAA